MNEDVIDVHCYYQRGLDFNWLDPAITGVISKISDGNHRYTKTVDGRTYRPEDLINPARISRRKLGAYHYAQPGSPVTQADLFLDYAEELAVLDYRPALDIEGSFVSQPSYAIDFGNAFCTRVRQRGYLPMVYMSDSFATATRPDLWTSKPALWIARYGRQPFTRYDMWQYTDAYMTLGNIKVDRNRVPNGNITSTMEVADMDDLQGRQLNEIHTALLGDAGSVYTPNDQGLFQRFGALEEKVANIAVAGIDLDVLAGKVADVLHNRLES